jgi:nucleoside-diphosphate-sugar epimerase
MKQRALVTGITGFIGGKLAERLLAKGWDVDAIVRPTSDIAALDLDRSVTFHAVEEGQDLAPVLEAARPDVVFHLASLYLADHRPDQIGALVNSNILFPTLLLEAMAATGTTRLVNTGTAWQHYEGAAYRPVNLYAATKQAMQDLVDYYCDAKGLAAVSLKLFDTYGDGDPRRKLIRILADAARSGDRLDISPGQQVVDLSHIDDVINAFLAAERHLQESAAGTHEIFAVSGERCTVEELVGKVEQASGRKLDVVLGGRPYRSREVMQPYVPTAAEAVPNWSPVRTLQATLPSLIRN